MHIETILRLISMLKSITRQYKSIENIPAFNKEISLKIVSICINRYVRFGTYGEPSMHNISLVSDICNVAKSWTGYTHQYFRKPEYNLFFMASVHNNIQARTAKEKFGYRSFIVTNKHSSGAVICPASKEAGYKSNCAKCGLCSGKKGKGKVDISILEH
jgi:hypothetical protein